MFQQFKIIVILFLYLLLHSRVSLQVQSQGYDSSRTHGGFHSDEQKYTKHIASIRTKTFKRFYGDNHLCAGTIIGSKTVLTAASCVVNEYGVTRKPDTIKVLFGTRKRLEVSKAGQTLFVKLVVPHYDYVKRKPGCDIALLMLKGPIIFDGKVEAIPLIETARKTESCTILGWGRVIAHGPMVNDIIYGEVRVTDGSSCKTKDSEDLSIDSLCATYKENNACGGDKGGPLICNGKLAGIVSYGHSCGKKYDAAFYTNVHFYLEWIMRNCICGNKLNVSMLLMTLIMLLL